MYLLDSTTYFLLNGDEKIHVLIHAGIFNGWYSTGAKQKQYHTELKIWLVRDKIVH
jgi:hypothetical protein